MIALLLLFVKNIFGFIDRMVALVIQYLYQLIIAIADTNVFGDTIYHYLGRIYTFLGIFMVFKLSVSMINYVINPDALTDKSKGFGKLISNVIISLILLVATPTLFNVAFDIQADILNSNALYQIVTGRKIQTATDTAGSQQEVLMKNAEINGKTIAYGVYSAFVYKSVDGESISEHPEGQRTVVSVACEPGTTGCVANKCQYGSIKCLLHENTLTHKDNTYWWLLSTVVGVAVAYILLGFCLDIALRSVKLGFLQIIAPIPIMMRMDPGAKDDKFSKWLKDVGGTFLSLFIRLAGLFFVIEIINMVMDGGMMESYSDPTAAIGGGGITGLFVKLFIIIGCLMFAKKLPQLISDLFGIKLDGDGFSLKKKMGNIPGLGAAKVLGAGALGFAGGYAANVMGATLGAEKGKRLSAFAKSSLGGSGFAGAFSGAYRGATSKEKNLFKATGAGIKGSVDARNLRDQRQATGYHIGRRAMAGINTFAGVDSLSHYDSQINQYSDIEKRASDILSRANGEMIKHNFNFNDSNGNSIDMNAFKASKEKLTLLRNQDTSAMTDAQRDAHAKLISDTQTYISKTEKLAEQAFVDQVQSGVIIDAQTTDMLSGLTTAISNSTEDIVKSQSASSGAAVKSAKDNMGNAIKHVQNSAGYQRAQANKKQK